MNRLVSIMFTLALASMVACQDEGEAPATDEAPAVESKAAEATEAAEPSSASDEKPRRTMKQVMEAVSESMKKAKDFETGDTPCERAYNGQVGMSRELMTALGSKEPPPTPDRDAFIELCESADAELQQCLLPSYALEHREECREVKEKNPEFAAKLKEIGQKAKEAHEAEKAEQAAP